MELHPFHASSSDPGPRPDASGLSALAAALDARLQGATPRDILAAALEALPGRICAVSSFGTESAVLLHFISELDRSLPILFLDTGHMFPETLAYRDTLIARLGLTGVRTLQPDAEAHRARDGDDGLWAVDPEACCALRKVEPLDAALRPFDAWINGRKRFQAATRADIRVVEAEAGRIKVNPLAALGPEEIAAVIAAHDLPEHPLKRHGFLSIGCMPCTSRVAPGEDPRAGRWRGRAKTECGIHRAPGSPSL